MGDALRFLWEKFFEYFPFRKVRVYEMGIIFFNGTPYWVVGAGIWFFIPGLEDVEIVNMQPDVWDLPMQTVTTADGESVALSANVEFQVKDALAMWLATQSPDENLPRIATRHINYKARGWTWDELRSHQKELEDSIKETLNTRAQHYGVKILHVGLTDIVKVRPYRVVTNDGGGGLLR